jgi:hypothetical protein
VTAERLLVVGGVGQILLALASLAVPRVLGWREELRRVTPFTRQVFWTYGAYVLGAHVAFGLLTLLHAEWFVRGEGPARAVAAFLAAWWGARLVLALVGRERSDLPRGPSVRAAHGVLVLAFASLATLYAGTAAGALGRIG